MDETTRHTIKISTTALQALRVIAAYTGKHQNALIEEWAQRELARITQRPVPRGTKGPDGPPDA